MLHWGRTVLNSPPPQSKDLEQQLQEELLEVVSELQTVRALQGLSESEGGHHLTSPRARLKERPGFRGPQARPSLPALGTGWLGRALRSESRMGWDGEGEGWLRPWP